MSKGKGTHLFNLQGVDKNYGLGLSWRKLLRRESLAMNQVEALKNIDLHLHPGECLGLLGPNGAGKSSLVKIICGLQQASRGSVEVLGFIKNFRKKDFLRRIGVVFGHKSGLWWDLPVKDSFAVLEKIYEVDKARYRNKLSELVDGLNLGHIMSRRVRNLSLGERVKCEVAASLAHEPKLIMLDEPTVGLDVVSRHELRKYIQNVVSEAKSGVIITSHDMADIEHCANRVAFLNKGQKIYDGPISSVNKTFGENLIATIIALNEPFSETFISSVRQGVFALLEGEGLVWKKANNSRIEWVFPSNKKQQTLELMNKMVLMHEQCQTQIGPAALEDVYLSYFKNKD